MDCQACGTSVSQDARYCHKCGARIGAVPEGRGTDWSTGLPWAAVGAAVGAVVTLLALKMGNAPSGGVSFSAPPPGPASDISRMTPEERATRLYNRVMRLDEQGQTDSVAFFVPMALQAYAMLPARDPDARYHIGLLELAGSNTRGALAQADTIHQMAPTHLFAFVLRARVGTIRSDADLARLAHADFRRHQRDERTRGRPEYEDHAAQLDAFGR